jgi:hypothetical protein
MDLKELKKLINEELNKKKSLEEQEKTGGARPSNVKIQPTPEKGVEEPTRIVPDIQGTTQAERTHLQLNLLFESVLKNPDFSKLHPETKKALILARDSYNSLLSTESELLQTSFKNQGGDFQIISDIAEISKKIAMMAPKSGKTLPSPAKKSTPDKTSVVSPNQTGQETVVSPTEPTRRKEKPVVQVPPTQRTTTMRNRIGQMVDKTKRTLGLEEE